MRPDLKLVVMSATLQTSRVSAYLDAPVLESRGRTHRVEISYRRAPDRRDIAVAMVPVVREILARR